MLQAAAVQQPVLKSQRSFNWAPPLLRDTGKLIFDLGQKCQVALGRAAGIIDFPVPANSSLRKTSSRSIRHYYVSGVACYLPIATMSLRQGVRLCEPIRVLDFGCGVGRQLLHFVRHFPAVQYSACDIDRTSIAFIEKNYPQVDSRVNRFEPPLPFAEDSMDMIYSVSTFSHINPDQQGRWLRELRRVVAPGGYCFLTTEGWTAFGMLRDAFGRPGDEAKLRDNGILYREYAFLEGERRRKSLSEQLQPGGWDRRQLRQHRDDARVHPVELGELWLRGGGRDRRNHRCAPGSGNSAPARGFPPLRKIFQRFPAAGRHLVVVRPFSRS